MQRHLRPPLFFRARAHTEKSRLAAAAELLNIIKCRAFALSTSRPLLSHPLTPVPTSLLALTSLFPSSPLFLPFFRPGRLILTSACASERNFFSLTLARRWRHFIFQTRAPRAPSFSLSLSRSRAWVSLSPACARAFFRLSAHFVSHLFARNNLSRALTPCKRKRERILMRHFLVRRSIYRMWSESFSSSRPRGDLWPRIKCTRGEVSFWVGESEF